jgi:hypothetical protein
MQSGILLKSRLGVEVADLLAAAILVTTVQAAVHNPDTDWFCDARWGVFVHYLWDVQNGGQRTNSLGRATAWDECVKEFDTEKFAEQIKEAGAEYVFFTMMQRTRYLIAPNATYDRLTGYKPGEACSTRDLVEDLYHSLDKRGIKLMLYWTGDGPREDGQAARGMGGWNGKVSDEYVRNWAEVGAEYSKRYGERVRGWWVDGCYEAIGYNQKHWGIMAAALRSGNPHAIVALNNPQMTRSNSSTTNDDFTTGEQNSFSEIPDSRWRDGVQWHVLSYLGPAWGAPGLSYSADGLAHYVSAVNAAGGVVTIDVALFRDGSIDARQLAALKAVRDAAGHKPVKKRAGARRPKVPQIAGDYVLIYKPRPDVYTGENTKNYRKGAAYKSWQPNDHTFIKGPDGRWHCFGITRPNDVKDDGVHEGEGLCFHAVAPLGTLEQAFRPQVWIDQPKLNVSGCGWAPVVLKIGDTYSIIGSGLGRAESKDLCNWEDKGRLAVKGDGRDPNVLFWNGLYYLVRCCGNSVTLVTSLDFVHWSEPVEIFKVDNTSWNCESPTLLRHENKFYLFWCLWDAAGSGGLDPKLYDGHDPSTYTYRTYVYASDTPTNFLNQPLLTQLNAHAPEIVQDEKGNWFISSADYPQRGVNLAMLVWEGDSAQFDASYSSSQGGGDWHYCFRGTNSGDCLPMTWQADHWQGRYPNSRIKVNELDADTDVTVLKWVAPKDGGARIVGTIWCLQTNGDGVTAAVRLNGQQLWPSSGPNYLTPDSWATHEIYAQVRQGDAITFELAPRMGCTGNRASWNPAISYGQSAGFVTDESIRVMDRADCKRIGIDYFDMQVRPIPNGEHAAGPLRWLHGVGICNGTFPTECFAGPLNHPSERLLFSKPQASYFTNPNHLDGHFWLMNIYQPASNLLIGVTHVEDCASALTSGNNHFRLGLSTSTNGGNSWTYLGPVITTAGDQDKRNIGGGPFAIKDGYFYLSYLADGWQHCGLARATLPDLLAAVATNGVPKFYKYAGETWQQPGLGGTNTFLSVLQLGNHNDLARCTADGKFYQPAIDTTWREIHLYQSADLIQWTDLGKIASSGNPLDVPHAPWLVYLSLVSADGLVKGDGTVGASFYVYYAKADPYGADGGNNPFGELKGNLVDLYRVKVALQ